MPKATNLPLVILAFFSIYVIWGSTFLMNKIAVGELPPLMLASVRFTSAGFLIFVICKLIGIRISVTKKQLLNTVIAGILFLAIGNGVVVWALKYVDSGFAALEISAQPLIVLLLMWILDGKKIKPMSILGVVFGVIGIYLLVSQQQIVARENSVIGMSMIFCALVCWAYGSIFVSKAELPQNFFVNTGYQMFSAGIILAIASFILGESWSMPATWETSTQISMLLLIFLGSIVAFTAFNYLLKVVSPEKVATSTYVNPIIALVLGWYFLNEQLTGQSMVAAGVLLTGVYFINTRKKLVIFSRFSDRIRLKTKKE